MKTKSALIADIDRLVGAVGDKFGIEMGGAGEGDAERDFIAERCPPRVAAAVHALPALSMHLLDAIADGPTGLVGLAARSGRLKGTVSKHVQRLVEANLVVRSPVPGNRKEIQLALTADGERVVAAHRELHDEMALGLQDFLLDYAVADLRVIETVLRDLLAAKRVGVRLSR
jgi:DNA-binding MarR family transcriptional regulator